MTAVRIRGKRASLGARIAAKVPRGLWFAHASGRFDRPDTAWADALRYYRRKAALITGTEAAGRNGRLFHSALGGTHWDYAHLSGAAVGECYATWDTTRLELLGRPIARQLTELTWVRSPEYGGKQAEPVHALVLKFRHIHSGRRYWVIVWHAPLDNTEKRAAAWVDCCDGIQGLVALVRDLKQRDPDAEPVIVGDYNKNLRLHDEAAMVRRHLEKPLGLVTSWALGLPKAGTHDTQVIDMALLRRPVLAACRLLRDLPDSDHRAFRYRLCNTKEKP